MNNKWIEILIKRFRFDKVISYSSYISKRIINKFIIHKDKKIKNILKVIIPDEIINSYDKDKIENISEKKYTKYINEFINTLTKNFTKENLELLDNNIKTLKTYRVYEKNIIHSGGYNMLSNKMYINEAHNILSIYHELFHMASTKINNDNVVSGFRKIRFKDDLSIGIGINEGYTELLYKRYFKDIICGSSISYKYLMVYAYGLEKIIGKDKMESLYLNANLNGLINELSNYSDKESTISFLKDTDYFFQISGKNERSNEEQDILRKCGNSSITYLLKCYLNKKIEMYNNDNSLSKEELIEDYIQYADFILNNLIANINNPNCQYIKNTVIEYINELKGKTMC